MEWDNKRIELMVEIINNKLATGETMKEIEESEFRVNERVIHKRLIRASYKRVGNKYELQEKGEVIQKYNKSITREKDEVIQKYNKSITREKDEVIQKYNKSITCEDDEVIQKYNESITELIEMKDDLKKVIQKYNESITNEKPNKIIKVKRVEDVKAKLFKVDIDILEKWEKFVVEHKEYKIQQLISLALEEFIDKYK